MSMMAPDPLPLDPNACQCQFNHHPAHACNSIECMCGDIKVTYPEGSDCSHHDCAGKTRHRLTKGPITEVQPI